MHVEPHRDIVGYYSPSRGVTHYIKPLSSVVVEGRCTARRAIMLVVRVLDHHHAS